MRKAIVAIVGRPNVGKSTLFNRLCNKRRAIVDFEEGITRDRKYENVEWNGKRFIVVDTGGIVPKSTDVMDRAIRFQAEVSIEEADYILFVVDAQTGPTDIDMEIAKILSKHRERVMLVVNKVDNEKLDLEIYDFMTLGLGEPFPVAAVNGRNTGNFLDALLSQIKTQSVTDEEDEDDSFKIAIVGKPNVGKSSLVNRLIGDDVVIVSDIPGTTRDAIDTKLKYHNKTFTFIDTAGLKKKTRIKYGVDYFSSMRTIESIRRADIVLLVMDAENEISTQDKKIASFAHRNFRDMVIVFNKWDLIEKDHKTINEYRDKIVDSLPFLEHAPFVTTSALSGQRVRKLLDLIIEVEENSNQRITTSKLNEFLEKAINKWQPTHPSGKQVKFFYASQVKTHPPTFVFFCNDSKRITENYKRYLHNRLRDEYGFQGAALKLLFRGRKKDEQ